MDKWSYIKSKNLHSLKEIRPLIKWYTLLGENISIACIRQTTNVPDISTLMV